MGITDIKIRIDDPRDVIEISKTLDTEFKGEFKTIGYHNPDGYMIAVITDLTKLSCEVSGMAKGKWFHPDIYADLFGYIFNTLGVKRINYVVEKDNHKCINLLERGGAVRECGLRGVNKYLYSMIKKDIEEFING